MKYNEHRENLSPSEDGLIDGHSMEFWEESFQKKQEMWGCDPALSAIAAKDFFLKKGVKNILIPGIGYGRNAKPFKDSGMNVTGIEISQTAINLARIHYSSDIKIYHGSVTNMPFDDILYDGIFCYGLLYLLDADEREKLLNDCYAQLAPGGYMIFSVISKKVPMYGSGKKLGTDRYETKDGVQIFFYDSGSIKQEFGKYGLCEFTEIDEPVGNKQVFKFILVTCRKAALNT